VMLHDHHASVWTGLGLRSECLGQFWKAEAVCGVQEYAECRAVEFGSGEQAQYPDAGTG